MVRFLQNLVFLFFVLFAQTLLGGTLTGELDRQQTSLDESFWLTVTIEGSLDGDVLEPETKDFEIQRTGQSTNISIMNGKMSKQTQYTYELRPLKEGSLLIPPFRARIDGQDLATESLPVVVKGGTPSPAEKGQVGEASKLLFVEREIPKSALYEGEAVISKVRLFFRARLTGATPVREASPDWRLIPVDGQKNAEVIRDGVRWSVIEMHEGLIPLKAGPLKAPPFGINATWIQQSKRPQSPRSIFDMLQGGSLGFGEEVSRKILSAPLTLTVKPLPTPKPQGFADIVGAFTVKADVSKRSLSVGETSTVTVELKGQGALDRMASLNLNIAGAKIYADKPSLKESVEAGAGLVSTKVFKFAVVPQVTGTLDLGKIQVASFNPFTEAYDRLSAELGAVTVSQSAVAASQSSPPQQVPLDSNLSASQSNHNQPPVTTPPDLSATKLGDHEGTSKKSWFLTPLALALELLILALIVSVWLFGRSWQNVRDERKIVEEVTRTYITDALTELERGGQASVQVALDALKKQLAGKGQDPGAMTSADLLKAADGHGLNSELRESLKRLLTLQDRVVYGGDLAMEASPSMVADLQSLLKFFQAKGV